MKRLLIIGGTRFLGRHIAWEALARGHAVTLFHRGTTPAYDIDGAREILGNRVTDLERLDGAWDAVIDTCGFVPRDVSASATILRNAAQGYVFISSVNALADPLPRAADETAPRWTTGDRNAAEMTLETYGPLKAACEEVVEETFEDAATIVRPGLIVGPHDPTDRLTYWVRRLDAGGTILAPGVPGRFVQMIDVRDLAEWIVGLVEQGIGGTFNATGNRHAMRRILDAAQTAAGSRADFVWASDVFLERNGVVPWSEMPLWIPQSEGDSFDSIDSSKAVAAGLQLRPLADTIAATLAWDRKRDRSLPMKAGISDAREAELLTSLSSHWRETRILR